MIPNALDGTHLKNKMDKTKVRNKINDDHITPIIK